MFTALEAISLDKTPPRARRIISAQIAAVTLQIIWWGIDVNCMQMTAAVQLA